MNYLNIFLIKIYKGLLNRKKFIFFKIYIHNIQKSFDYKIINKNEYDILNLINNGFYNDYLKTMKLLKIQLFLQMKRSFFDMLSFNKPKKLKKEIHI